MRLKDNSRMQHPRTMLDILLRNEQGAIEAALQSLCFLRHDVVNGGVSFRFCFAVSELALKR